MKKILIFSDTHGDINRCLDIIEKADSVSAIFHAGDYTGDAEDLESIYPNIPIYYVKGNNDYFSKTPSHMLVTIDGVKIFITHGHEQNVKYEYEFMTLRKAAEKYDPGAGPLDLERQRGQLQQAVGCGPGQRVPQRDAGVPRDL